MQCTTGMNNSDIISILALLSSIGFGIANWIHTNRSFKASSYPCLQIQLLQTSIRGNTILSLEIFNSSNTVSALDIELFVKISQPDKKWFQRKKWFIYRYSGELQLVKPGTGLSTVEGDKNDRNLFDLETYVQGYYENEDFYERLKTLEAFVLISFPKVLAIQHINGAGYYCKVQDATPLDLLVTLKGRSNIAGVKPFRASYFHQLTPCCELDGGGPSDMLSYWEIREVTGIKQLVQRLSKFLPKTTPHFDN
jgi:hypothetical protein